MRNCDRHNHENSDDQPHTTFFEESGAVGSYILVQSHPVCYRVLSFGCLSHGLVIWRICLLLVSIFVFSMKKRVHECVLSIVLLILFFVCLMFIFLFFYDLFVLFYLFNLQLFDQVLLFFSFLVGTWYFFFLNFSHFLLFISWFLVCDKNVGVVKWECLIFLTETMI